jgi:hypothetical protein
VNSGTSVPLHCFAASWNRFALGTLVPVPSSGTMMPSLRFVPRGPICGWMTWPEFDAPFPASFLQ